MNMEKANIYRNIKAVIGRTKKQTYMLDGSMFPNAYAAARPE